MASLGNVYHDFPFLAKQSGFYFQLHTGRVNWSEIENLNIDEIIEKRNFQLLERNLVNVINCNLEREYDLKILDQNFVKLFKLAQLGVDYLSYCEMYLDKCVVLLQKQLAAFQEELESFKQESHEQKEEISKSKKNNKTPSYQCEKCEKAFISDVYLKFHDMRRHSNVNTPKSLDTSLKKFIDNCQQTEDERKLSTPIQALVFNEEIKVDQECVDRSMMEVEHTIKIEKLEQELKDLKEHLKTAEKTEATPSNLSNIIHPFNIPNSKFCNPMLMFLPSYLSTLTSGQCEINPTPSSPVPEIHQPESVLSCQINTEVLENKFFPQNMSQYSSESGKEKSCESEKENNCAVENIKNIQDSPNKEKAIFEYDKENINPNIKRNILTKPLPPPRKLKKGIHIQESLVVDKKNVETFSTPKNYIHKEQKTSNFNNQSILHTSTSIKENFCEGIDLEVLEESKESPKKISAPEMNSTESLQSRNPILADHECKIMFDKIVARDSPKVQKLSKNFKKSLTNLYDSISSTEKISKKRESGELNPKAAVVSGLNNRLQELGVDPEWKGIPKKTVRKKLSILKQRRKLFSKENPLYPVIRQNIEEKIFQNLKKKFVKKKTTLTNKLHKQESMNVKDTQDILLEEKSDFVKVKNCAMYNYESDSESKADSESSFIQATEEKTFQKPILTMEEFSSSGESEEKIDINRKKEHLSVFQVCEESMSNLKQKHVSFHKAETFTDPDSFLEKSHSKGLNGHLNCNAKTESLAISTEPK